MATHALQHGEDKCPVCGLVVEQATNFRSVDAPTPGSFFVCIRCGAVGVFARDMRLRAPTRAELHEAQRTPAVLEAQAVVEALQVKRGRQ